MDHGCTTKWIGNWNEIGPYSTHKLYTHTPIRPSKKIICQFEGDSIFSLANIHSKNVALPTEREKKEENICRYK